MRAGLAVSLVALIAGVAAAGPRVVVVETRGAPALPGLAAQVELHASRPVTVSAIVASDADPLTYAEQAAALVASGQATVVVWIAPVDRGFLVFAAGAWPGRALIELVRIDADLPPPEIERTVALKVAGLLDALLSSRASARRALAIAVAPRPSAEWRIELDGVVARDPHQRGLDGRPVVAIGRARNLGAWTLAPAIAGHWQPGGTIDAAPGRAAIDEVAGVASLEVGHRLGPIDGFARPRVTAAALVARGASNDGRTGRATLFAPYAGLEVGVRRELTEHVSLGVLAGTDVALIHHRLLIDGVTVVDLGRARVHVGLSLTVAL